MQFNIIRIGTSKRQNLQQDASVPGPGSYEVSVADKRSQPAYKYYYYIIITKYKLLGLDQSREDKL